MENTQDQVKKAKRTYVLDTNVLLSDVDSIYAFEDNDVVVPLAVLEELDRQKVRQDDVGKNARHVSRTLDKMRAKGSLLEGVALPGGGVLKVVHSTAALLDKLPPELREVGKTDNYLIALMVMLKTGFGINAVMVSKDINVRIKCDSLGVPCEDYLKMRVADDPVKFYTGVRVVEDVDPAVIETVHSEHETPVPDMIDNLMPNQIVVLKHVDPDGRNKMSAMTRYVGNRLKRIVDPFGVFGLKHRNKEQLFAFDMLLDPDIKLVTLVGPAGTGKTLLSMAAGLEQLRGLGKHNRYEKLIVTRPVQPVGRDIGFLPGTLQEKMEPWVSPIRDNLEQLVPNRTGGKGKGRPVSDEPYLSLLLEHGKIEIEAITFIRGRSIPNAFIVIDEAQNLTLHELKTIITRAGEGTKIVLTGDIEQIDNVHVDVYTNGLTYAAEKFKSHDIAGHVTLCKGERSQLATIASQIL